MALWHPASAGFAFKKKKNTSCTRIQRRRTSVHGCRMLPVAFHGRKAKPVAGEHTAMEGLRSLLAVILSLLIIQVHFSLVLSFVARL